MSTGGNERLERAKATADRLLANIETVVHGKTERIQLVLAALICRGHVLFEDVPGTAKTVLARAIARSIDGAVPSRVQCTPDLQPTDVTRPLPVPFLLLATENPIEYEGTFPLPEAQLDRFFLKTALGYPSLDDELRIVLDQQGDHHPIERLPAVVTTAEVSQLQSAIQSVYVDELLRRWIVEVVRATRDVEMVSIGASVRGTLALERAA